MLTNVFVGQEVQRAVEKIKPNYGSEEWLVGREEVNLPEEEEEEPLPPRVPTPPHCRYLEEC